MSTRPTALIAVLIPLAPLCSRRVWQHTPILLAGALLAAAQRTVPAVLRVMGRAQLRQFHRYQRVRSRDHGSRLAAGRVLRKRGHRRITVILPKDVAARASTADVARAVTEGIGCSNFDGG